MKRLIGVGMHLTQSRIVRTAIVGVVGVFFQTVVFEALGVYFKVVTPSTATIIGCEVGIIVNYMLNSRFSFADRAGGYLPYRFLRFHLVALGSVFIQWVLVFTAQQYTENLILIHIAYASGILIGFTWNYNWYRLWVWRHHHPQA